MNKLSYTRSGTPDAPAIVFLHGMGMGQWMWHEQIQHFADYDCYNIDLPGHGESAAVAWESLQQVADTVAHTIQSDIKGKAIHLVAMSVGAIVSLYVLAQDPTLFSRAILTGTIAKKPPRWVTMIQGNILAALLPTGFGKAAFARMLHLPQDAMPHYKASIAQLSIPSFKQATRNLVDFELPPNLEKVTVPIIVVTGEKDQKLVTQSVKDLAALLPQAKGFYAPGSHHGWNGEDPELFNAMARAWLNENALPEQLIVA